MQLSQLSLWWIAIPLFVLALLLPAVEIGGSDLFGHAMATQTMPGSFWFWLASCGVMLWARIREFRLTCNRYHCRSLR